MQEDLLKFHKALEDLHFKCYTIKFFIGKIIRKIFQINGKKSFFISLQFAINKSILFMSLSSFHISRRENKKLEQIRY